MLAEYLSKHLLLETSYINLLADTASNRYFQYSIPKKSGGFRTILQPSKELKTVQKLVYEDIILKFPVHDAAFAYKRNIGLIEHAKAHLGSKYLLRLDFKKFFESINSKDIEKFFSKNIQYLSSDWNDKDTSLLIKLVCFRDTLTIGSVSSPSISNVLCFELDNILDNLCTSKGVKYSRYADDMYFSTSQPNLLPKIQREVSILISRLEIPSKLKINNSKTHHSSSKNKMSVTGLVLTNKNQVSIGRQSKKKVKAMIHQWGSLEKKEKSYIVGYLSYCLSVEPEFLNSLCRKYGASTIYNIQTAKL